MVPHTLRVVGVDTHPRVEERGLYLAGDGIPISPGVDHRVSIDLIFPSVIDADIAWYALWHESASAL